MLCHGFNGFEDFALNLMPTTRVLASEALPSNGLQCLRRLQQPRNGIKQMQRLLHLMYGHNLIFFGAGQRSALAAQLNGSAEHHWTSDCRPKTYCLSLDNTFFKAVSSLESRLSTEDWSEVEWIWSALRAITRCDLWFVWFRWRSNPISMALKTYTLNDWINFMSNTLFWSQTRR